MEDQSKIEEATEYDVAQVLGHPLPAPRNSTVWVAAATDPYGNLVQVAGSSKNAALDALSDATIAEWRDFTDFSWLEVDENAFPLDPKEALAARLENRTGEALLDYYTENLKKGWRVVEIVIR